MVNAENGNIDLTIGHYWKGEHRVKLMADEYAAHIDKAELRERIKNSGVEIHPTLCISRNIGVGALELAEMLGEQLGLRVIDREIIEYIANTTELNRKSIATFDERYPGMLKEIMCRILGDRVFDMSEYARHLFYVAFSIAHMAPTIFVGRGVHLMLPRTRVFALRCVSSREFRVQRLMASLNIKEEKAVPLLEQADYEQREFFLKIHAKEKVPAVEFDMIINMDRIENFDWTADAIGGLFKKRFSLPD